MEAVITKQKISYILFALSLLIIVLIEVWAYRNSQQLLRSSEWLSHTHAVMNQITKIDFLIADAQASRRGYVITNDDKFLEPYNFAVNNLNKELALLREMISDNPNQIAHYQSVTPLIADEMNRLKEAVAAQKQMQMTPQDQLQFMEKGKILREGIKRVLDDMKRQEISLLESRRGETERESMQITAAMILGTLFSIVLVISGFVVLHKEVVKRRETETRLESSSQRFRALASHLQFVREEERAKIAREIHDELGQVLTALKIDLSLLNNKMLDSSAIIPRQSLSSEIESMRNMVDITIQSVRRMITDLRPEILDHLGLQAAIDWHAQQFKLRTKIPVDIKSNLDETETVNPEKAAAIFRIFQETLTNVARHAKATHVEVELNQQHNMVVLKVKDNGLGITEGDLAKTTSFGILGLKERAYLLGGEVDIQGQPGSGTTVSVRIPISSLYVRT